MAADGPDQTWELDGRPVRVTSLDRRYWPDEGITKGDLLAYYRDVAPVMVPYLRGRAVTLVVYPDGAAGKGYYRRAQLKTAPDWLPSFIYHPESRLGEVLDAPVIDEAAGLIWYANQGSIEFHMWLSKPPELDRPDWAAFDLDPGERASFAQVLQTAVLLRDLLESEGVTGYPKTSGGAGIHVFVPLAPEHPFDAVRDWVEQIGARLAEAHPELVAVPSGRTHIGDRVTVDYAQNSIARNTAAPYTVRARPGAPVSAPVTWDEVEAGKIRPADFTLLTMPDRLKKLGDLWAPALKKPQQLRLEG